MREYKFRGKRVDAGEWIYGCLVVNPYETSICDENDVTFGRYDVVPETVGQYITLKDKNGAEIYEGDIVSHGGQWRGAVSFGEFQVFTEDDSYWCLGWMAGDIELDPRGEPLQYIVIGNIYENPELLDHGVAA
ncbi:YopX family protein [Rhodococcus sp. IEGM 1351]|uniref:YopX family protein n=1 Tax=Rhodococcus sp. IEGM 1351 TaxID=3047089 RepID=UPI0024B823EC|nr:YopX family protein [Rhodococcus sp. IEGM 1351]MDI9934721.1 YopX family protein [Rhodococcus sp. IEGM 1351]